MLNLTQDAQWLRNHIILLALAAGIAFGSVYYVDSLLARHAKESDQKWQSILVTQQQQTQTIQTQLAQDETKWAALNVQLVNANQKLAATIAARDVAVAAQVKQDASLTAQETATKLGGTTNGEDIELPLGTGRGLAVSLDTLAGTQADLADTKTRLSNETTLAANLQFDITEKDKFIAAMKVQNDNESKACKAEVADIKAQARRSKLRWLGVGIIIGFIGAHLAGF
jgi:hypothetical protein